MSEIIHPERPYGSAPELFGEYDLEFHEYMHYMYLPIRIDSDASVSIPERLSFASHMVDDAIKSETARGNQWRYIYLTARRGFATPGNPLNRPGWHSDGFGTEDVNYVWTNRFPTLFAIQEFGEVVSDHSESIAQFESQVEKENIVTYGDSILMRLDPSVIHAAPEIPAPGGERSFFKISFSNARYDLRGNSHNYLLDYSWEMFDRSAARNDPSRSNSDSSESL